MAELPFTGKSPEGTENGPALETQVPNRGIGDSYIGSHDSGAARIRDNS